VWCRYWCPLAKYMELLSHWFGKLKITSNEKCIQCGICITVCLMELLKFGEPIRKYTA
jgi:NAD-dependent dihydropyrimidine dehydrogenase PreA subunit